MNKLSEGNNREPALQQLLSASPEARPVYPHDSADGMWIYARSSSNNTSHERSRWIAIVMFLMWLGVVSFLAYTHLVWRDEVRALSLATQGRSLFSMLKGIHGEGHPAVWYLLLRGAHALVPRPEILLVVSLVVAAIAMLILVLRAPFSLPILALILLTNFSRFEYSVMARNYGISMLLLFLFAALYETHRRKDCVLGVLLFLLANCNVHSVLLVGGLLLLWLVDILGDDAANRPHHLRLFLYNAIFAAVGIVACFITVYPPFNDLAANYHNPIKLKALFEAVFLPSLTFDASTLVGAGKLTRLVPLLGKPLIIFQSMILFGSTLGLIRRPGAFLAALTTLVGFSLFFVVVYPGAYRHQALWLVFLVCLYWIAAAKPGHRYVFVAQPKSVGTRLLAGGRVLFVAVLLLQLRPAADVVIDTMLHPIAALKNRKNEVGSIFAAHSELRHAVVIAEPDYFLETLPYYVSNPTYFMREHRYGSVVHFTRNAQLELNLGDVLADARRLRRETGGAIVILLAHRLDASLPPQAYPDALRGWIFYTTPEEERSFLAATHFIEHHSAPAESDEQYDVYVLDTN